MLSKLLVVLLEIGLLFMRGKLQKYKNHNKNDFTNLSIHIADKNDRKS